MSHCSSAGVCLYFTQYFCLHLHISRKKVNNKLTKCKQSVFVACLELIYICIRSQLYFFLLFFTNNNAMHVPFLHLFRLLLFSTIFSVVFFCVCMNVWFLEIFLKSSQVLGFFLRVIYYKPKYFFFEKWQIFSHKIHLLLLLFLFFMLWMKEGCLRG